MLINYSFYNSLLEIFTLRTFQMGSDNYANIILARDSVLLN
jgi:hypothetical protein